MHQFSKECTSRAHPSGTTDRRDASRHVGRPLRGTRGQVLVIFAMALVVLVGLVGIVIDISWYWSNSLAIQRAADAAALAGAVDLPTKPGTFASHPTGTAIGDALAEASKNGYGSLTLGCKADNRTPSTNPGICVYNDQTNPNQLAVSIASPVQTSFARVLGVQTWNATRYSTAQFTLPVPMGSPENYYGVFGPVRNATMTTMTLDPSSSWDVSTGARQSVTNVASSAPSGTWTTSQPTSVNAALAVNEVAPATIYYAQTNTNGATHQLGTFAFTGAGGIPAPTSMPIPTHAGDTSTAINMVGLQVQLNDALVSASCSGANRNSTIGVSVTYDGGGHWSTPVKTGNLPTSATTGDFPLGNTNNFTPWVFSPAHTWVRDDFADGNFLVRLTANKGSSCAGTTYLQLDQLQVIPYYTVTTTTATESPHQNTQTYALTGPGTPCVNGVANCYSSNPADGGQALNTRGFWATMNTEGAANLNGDAFQPFYDNPTSSPAQTCPSPGNACYDATDYYNYAVKMPPNTTGGYVYIFDPVFCATALNDGLGDRWFGGSNQMSSWYELFADTNNTPYNLSDDTLVATSGTKFQDIAASDSTMGGSGGSECKQSDQPYGNGRDYHDAWYLLNPANPLSGGADGTTYRLHTTSSVPPGQSDGVNQKNSNGEQSFAIFANNAEGTTANGLLPQVYGLGAMQMFTPLSSSGGTTNSTFYLAQVPAYYAGKILEIKLWDPGDTNPLRANLYIEIPQGGSWVDTPFTYSAHTGTTGGANSACNSMSNSATNNYTVQTNAGATTGNFNGCWLTLDIPIPNNYAGDQNGWWLIRYSMTGNGTSSDVTTWTASIKGNPVHLIVP